MPEIGRRGTIAIWAASLGCQLIYWTMSIMGLVEPAWYPGVFFAWWSAVNIIEKTYKLASVETEIRMIRKWDESVERVRECCNKIQSMIQRIKRMIRNLTGNRQEDPLLPQ